jgi:uncharacterized protein
MPIGGALMKKRNSNKRFQIITYLLITFLFSWIPWGMLYASFKGWISSDIYYNHFILFFRLGSFMPSIMSVFFTVIFYRINGIKELFKKIIIWKINPFYYMFVLFFTLATFYIPIWICNFTGLPYKFHVLTNFRNILFTFLVILLIGGPLGEELGWRGYVLPKLQCILNPIYSSLFFGIIWACWHLPLFFIPNTSQFGFPFIIFVIEDIYLATIFTWVYNRTNGSLIFPILFHAAFNTTVTLLYSNPLSYFVNSLNGYTVIYFSFQFVILVFVILDMKKNPHSNHLQKIDEEMYKLES